MKKIIIVLLVVMTAAGCATMTNAPIPTAEAPAAGQGIAVVSITTNSSGIGEFDSIQLLRVSEGAESSGFTQHYVLEQAVKSLARDTALFIGVLPAGEYKLEQFNESRTQRYLQLSEAGSAKIGTFRVRAGAMADLGRLLVTQVNALIIVGRSSSTRSNSELVKRAVPTLAGHYTGPVDTGWTRELDKDDIAERYALGHPIGITSLTELSNGEIAAATRMGTLLMRDTGGHWRRINDGRLESLMWIKRYDTDDCLLLAVGEFNALFRMNHNGKLTAMDTGNLPFGNILFIDGNEAAGWFTALQRGNDVSLFHTASLSSPNWELLRSATVGANFWHGADLFWIWPTSGGFAFAVSKGDINVYDYAAHTWSERHAPNDNRLLSIAPSAGDRLGILTSPGGGFGGIFAHTYYSRDLGQTWAETNSPFKVKVFAPRFTSKGTMLEMGGVFGKTGIQASKDDGKTWEPWADRSSLSNSMWIMPTQGLFLVSNGLFGIESIEHSNDEGRTWTLEETTYEGALFDKQNKK